MTQQSGSNERFELKRKGDILSADFINRVAAAVTRLSSVPRGADVMINSAGVFPRPSATTSASTSASAAADSQFVFHNDSGFTIPPYAVVRMFGTTAPGVDGVIIGRQSNKYGSQYRHFANSADEVAVGEQGVGFHPSVPLWLSYDTGDMPLLGEVWGPVAGSWELKSKSGGFSIIGGAINGRVLVSQNPMLFVEGILDGALDAATNALTTPTDAQLSVYVVVNGLSTDLEDSTFNVTVTNRQTEHEQIVLGSYLGAQWIDEHSQWRPITADCGATTIA